jgi:hypothetical protein
MNEYIPQQVQSRDKNGLRPGDYDKNGWARLDNGKWVANPASGAFIRYAKVQVIPVSSKSISSARVLKNENSKAYKNFSSLRDVYPLLEKVANNLQYSDIQALYDSFRKYEPLEKNWYYDFDGKKFYSNEALFDYKIQKAKAWGSKNDQNGDGEINCMDYAELFYKYATEEGYHVRYISNDKLNHAFNGINVGGSWIAIEPQAAETGLDKSPLISVRWNAYNPAYDKIKKEM